ncbi:hypothetical protein Tco_1241395 [Tanacetum coccineum]
MVPVAWLCWLNLALVSSGFVSFCIGYCLVGSVYMHLSAVCLNLLLSVVCLTCSRSSPYLCDSVLCTCLICSRSSPYLCDSVLCSCLLFVYLCSDLSAAEYVFMCSSSSTSVRTSMLNLHMSAALRLPLFGSLCCLFAFIRLISEFSCQTLNVLCAL